MSERLKELFDKVKQDYSRHEEKRLPNITILLNGTKKKSGYGYGYGGDQLKKKWYQFS